MYVKVKPLKAGVDLPEYQTPKASGMDLRAYLEESVTVTPMEIVVVPTAIALAIPEGFEAQIRPRSGLATKGLTVINSPGTIDADYRGEIKIALINLGSNPITISHGERIAQIVFAPVQWVQLYQTDELDHTFRGESGFGHTGT